MRRFVVLCCLVAGCSEASSDPGAPQIGIGGAAAGPEDGAPCTPDRCGDPDAPAILYPGDPACDGDGCERTLAGDDVSIPPRNGRPWGDTFRLGTDEPAVFAGYSSGRIALLRRLALVGDGRHAVMLDPLWPDGERDFLGRGPERGEEIVRDWLRADPRRTFLLIHSRRSAGWAGYAALQDTDVGARVTVCAVDEPHLRVPAAAGIRDALVDPAGWDNGACRRGS